MFRIRGNHEERPENISTYKYEPVEVFLSGIDQSKVDKSMEFFLDKTEDTVEYNK